MELAAAEPLVEVLDVDTCLGAATSNLGDDDVDVQPGVPGRPEHEPGHVIEWVSDERISPVEDRGDRAVDDEQVARGQVAVDYVANTVWASIGEPRESGRPTDIVVTSGQFLIDSESNVESALARMDERVAEMPASTVQVAATVRSIDTVKQKLVLHHEPIAEWSWPAMTMGFAVESEHLLMGLEVGQPIDVTIEEQAGGIYVITAVTPTGQGQ